MAYWLQRLRRKLEYNAEQYSEPAVGTGDLLITRADRVHVVSAAGVTDGSVLYRDSTDPVGVRYGPSVVLDVLASDPASPVDGQMWLVVP